MARQTEAHYHHLDTPRKARVKGAVAFAQMQKQRYGHDFSYQDIFRCCQVSKSRGYEILKSSSDRTFHNEFEETRGRKKLLTDKDIDKLKKLIWSEGFEARGLTWPQLLPAAGIDKQISLSTVRRVLSLLRLRTVLFTEKVS